MKAKYLIEAIRAMRVAEALNYKTDPHEFGRSIAGLTIARIDLEAHSGLCDVEIPVECEDEPFVPLDTAEANGEKVPF